MRTSTYSLGLLAAALFAAPAVSQEPGRSPAHLCDAYDVDTYELDLAIDPERRRIEGEVRVDALVTAGTLGVVQLEMDDALTTLGVTVDGEEREFEHANDRLRIALEEPLSEGEGFLVAVRYHGEPRAANSFSGFHWETTADGSPWIGTSCQGPGAHSWWPCKASFFHPEDKPEHLRVNLTVPGELYAVSNGRLTDVVDLEDGRKTFRWAHDYPLETYTVTVNVAPYVVVESELELPGLEAPVPYVYYVLPENAEKAAVQFRQVPELLTIYSEAFGPWPFPESKFGLVETSFWGMEHSTAVAYGSSYPAWCAETGAEDRYAGRNRWFDYILVHEVAHEWWGNAVSARDWGDFWIHEGFGTYAEGVYVERTQGREAADRWFEQTGRGVGATSRLYRGKGVNSGQAYSGVIYSKGAWVLNALRHHVDDDEAWWQALREFNLEFRYKNAGTDDFRAVLEEVTGGEWKAFFDSYVYGAGYPLLEGRVEVRGQRLHVALQCVGSDDSTGFTIPVDLAWVEAGAPQRTRLWVGPDGIDQEIPCAAEPTEVSLPHIGRVVKFPRRASAPAVELP